MSELLPRESMRLDDYQKFVGATTLKEAGSGPWEDVYSSLIEGEQLEFLGQHGPGALLLLPRSFGYDHTETPDDLRFNMADEMGDLLWFGTSVTERVNTKLTEVCANSLSLIAEQPAQTIQTFAELEEQVSMVADKVTVPNKTGLLFPDISPAVSSTTLTDNPHYLFLRAVHRLSRSLDQGRYDMSPPTATELEPIQDTAATLGLYFLVLAYIAKDRIGIALGDIAKFNVAKLDHRQQFGKVNDLVFDNSFIYS